MPMCRSALPLLLVAGLAATASAQVFKGPSTNQFPYMKPADAASGIRIYSVASNGNGTGGLADELYTNIDTLANTYRMVGIPDGAGAYPVNTDGGPRQFNFTMNHELGRTAGIARRTGQIGAFVSEWRINGDPTSSNFLQVIGAHDQASTIVLFEGGVYVEHTAANPGVPAFDRFCSADMAPSGAYAFGALGTTERIHMNGEETGAEGRAMAFIATGPDAGKGFQLPALGRFSWENSVTCPVSQAKTIVAGLDDSTPGNVYFYIGTKLATGNTVQRAGLTNGALWGIQIADPTISAGQAVESTTNVLGNATKVISKPFTLYNFGDVSSKTGAQLQTESDAAAVRVLNLNRPEDGAWDPRHPNRFYFVTTASITGPSRLFLMEFSDITQPELGGRISMLMDGNDLPGSVAGGFSAASGVTDIRMMDNIAVTQSGHIIIQEDTGNNPRLARMWDYDTAHDSVIEIAVSDPELFTSGVNPAKFLTQDEETSGVIEMRDTIAPGYIMFDIQAHYAPGAAGPVRSELVEGGQIMAAFLPSLVNIPCSAADIGCDDGTPLFTGHDNNGVNEGDYNAFFNGFFNAASYTNIANDAGNPLPRGESDSGINEGDYNLFFNTFFLPCI
ncbi:hypothetical protein BH11PLA1_BH11PLA1_24420 [soil metagenome]